MKKITLGILLLLSMLSFGQSVSVTVTQLKVLNLAATTVNFATNVTSVNVSITVSAHTSYSNTAKGSIAVYYKRNSSTSTTPIIPTNGYDGNFFLTNGSNGGTGTKTFTITLSRSQFDETGGIVYLEYRPDVSNLLAYKSSNINVTKFDVTVPTTPTVPVTNNNISGSQTISEGQSPTTLVGSIPSGGNGTFTYAWQAKTENGTWMLVGSISSSNPNYSPGVSSVTKTYRRIAQSGTESTISNEIIVTVIPPPIIQNNTITLDGVIVSGSLPTGGIGSYSYSWYILDDGERTDLNEKSQSFQLFTPNFDKYFDSSHNLTITRLVTSGNQITASNRIEIPYVEATPLLNNTITLNGNIVSGSLPTGGRGSYLYSWYILDDGERTDLNETTQSYELFTPSFNKYFDSSHNLTITRLVTAGNQITASNRIEIPNNSGKSTAVNQENTLTSVVYPNPTSGSVNFTTVFSTNKEIEIIVYSEEFAKTQSVFKGIVTPNQIVTWDIPSNYPKGIYFYKIVSGNEEIKLGKIIFQ